jgi:hypothetical protein
MKMNAPVLPTVIANSQNLTLFKSAANKARAIAT